jgi:alkaline phosphatase D
VTPARLARLVALVALLAAAAPALGDDGPLVTVGEVGPTTAVIWTRGERAGEISVEVTPVAGGRPLADRVRVTEDGDLLGRVTATGLAPASRYRYRVQQGERVVSGEFGTAPVASSPAKVTFLWSGDLGGGGFCRLVDGGYRIFPVMARRAADFFLFVGDTIYADVPCNRPGVVPGADFIARSVAQYRARHRYNREDPAVQEFLRRVPVYAIWDDHEVRNDFSGPTEPLMPIGRQAFLEYWPIVAPGNDPNRLYRTVRWGRLLEVFILDTRQYRSPNGEPDGPAKTMLGAAQRAWLVDALAASDATWKIVVTSVPLSVPTGRPDGHDSWTGASVFGIVPDNPSGFATERDAILRDLRARGVKNLVFLAADVHHAEIIRHEPQPGFAFYEFIAGPLSASLGRPRPLDETLNSWSLFARGGVYNFGEVTIDAAGLTVRSVDDTGAVMFTHTITPQ